MSIIESLILAFALCADTLAVSAASGLKYNMSKRRWLMLASILALFQGLFPMLGAIIGVVSEKFISAVDHWIAFGLLLSVGAKMIFDAFTNHNDEKKLDIANIGTMCILGVATSIDAFAVGIGFGLNSTFIQSATTCAIITGVTFLVAIMGICIGRSGRHISQRWSGLVAGLVLISIGCKILIEHLAS